MGRFYRALAENWITRLLVDIPVALDLVAKGFNVEVGHHFGLNHISFLNSLTDFGLVVHPHGSPEHFSLICLFGWELCFALFEEIILGLLLMPCLNCRALIKLVLQLAKNTECRFAASIDRRNVRLLACDKATVSTLFILSFILEKLEQLLLLVF